MQHQSPLQCILITQPLIRNKGVKPVVEETKGMQVKQEKSQEEIIQVLQCQVDELTASNLLLQDQLARKEQFTAMIAHELRGPLSPIINYAQMLSRHAQTPVPNGMRSETTQRYINIIISEAWRLTRLTN